jgi:hypothetical protein
MASVAKVLLPRIQSILIRDQGGWIEVQQGTVSYCAVSFYSDETSYVGADYMGYCFVGVDDVQYTFSADAVIGLKLEPIPEEPPVDPPVDPEFPEGG